MNTYGKEYWEWLNEQSASHDDSQRRAILQAGAFAEAAELLPHMRILDYGCGRGELVAALRGLGFNAEGVDISEWPIAHCVPEAKDYVRVLGDEGIAAYGDKQFDLVIAKDVFEHIAQDALSGTVQELMQKTRKLVFMCPITDEAHTFICPNDEEDETHVTRMTRDEWLHFFPFAATPLDDLTRHIRGPEYFHGSVSVLLRHKKA